MRITLPSSASSKSPETGMTLLELMVAMSLMTVIVLGLYLMFDRVQRAFRSSTAQTDVLDGARSTVNIVSRDLEQMRGVGTDPNGLIPNLAQSYLNVYADDFTPTIAPVAQRLVDGTVITNHAYEVLFLTSTNGSWNAVGYRLATRTNYCLPPTNGVGTLLRYEYVMSGPEDLRIVGGQNVTNNPLHRFTSLPGALPSPFAVDFQPVLDGVVHFAVHLVAQSPLDPTGQHLPIMVTLTNVPGSTTNQPPSNAPFGRPPTPTIVAMNNNEMPRYVEFELGVVEPATVDQVRGLPTIAIQTNFMALPEQASKVHFFKQRIVVKQGF